MIFGWSLVRTSELKELQRYSVKYQKVIQCRRWFSGWKDLDFIWDYIMEDTNYGGIEQARRDYADARNTDQYGTLKTKTLVDRFLQWRLPKSVRPDGDPNGERSGTNLLTADEAEQMIKYLLQEQK